MESLATVLRRIPIFAGLPPGSFAKIIADLREETYAPGAVICYEGEPAHDFYIIKSGSVAVFINRAGDQRELVAVNGPNEWFGERALFSDAPRSATVVARSSVELWRLTKEKFDGLIEENPWLVMHFAQVISERLYRGNQELSNLRGAFGHQMAALFRGLSPQRRHFLTRAAVLTKLEPQVLLEVTGEIGDEHLAVLQSAGGFLAGRDGGLSFLEAVREFLLAQLRDEIGSDGVRELQRLAARCYEREGRWELAIAALLEARDYDAAAKLLAMHADALMAERRFDLLRRWIALLPAEIVHSHLAEVRQRLDAPLRAAGPVTPRPASRIGLWLQAGFGVALGLAIALLPPPSGLSPQGMAMLGLLTWAAVFWAFDVLPDYVVGLVMMIGWILFRIVPIGVAVSGFTTSPFFLIIGVLGIGTALQSSGLLFRLALQILRRFPLTHGGQSLGLALSGSVITSGIPDVTSGVAIASPIILALSDSLGYKRRSNGSAGLAMAAVLGFGQMSPFFLTGAAENMLAWGLLPESMQGQITWIGWLVAAMPLALATFGLGFAATMFLLPPETQPTVSRGLIETQIEALGPVSLAEKVNGGVLLAAIVGWITAPYHGFDVGWIAMSGLAILLAANFLDRAAFRTGIYWDFLFYLGAVLSLTAVVHELGVDAWVVKELTPLLEPMAKRPSVFLLIVALAMFAARFILPSFALVSVVVITLVPIAVPAGISVQVLLLVICTTVAVWFLPYQSTYYLALYFGTKEKAFTHRQVRLLAWSYGLIYLVAIAIAIPYWNLIGLLP